MAVRHLLLCAALFCLVVTGNAVPGRQLHHRSKYTWKDFAALGQFAGTLATPMSGKQVSGGNKKDHGMIRMSVFKKDSDYNVYYNGKVDLKDSGYPTTVGIFKGQRARLERWRLTSLRTPRGRTTRGTPCSRFSGNS
ncbi:hypothetical protein CLOP_g11493 [Closterium sp. NIES-67]|nr:hypothetical protein CLOP_g11493 [Closterium sp. NIES-67]